MAKHEKEKGSYSVYTLLGLPLKLRHPISVY